MIRYAAVRFFAVTTASWLAAVALSFAAIRLIPGDPVDVFIQQANIRASEELIAAYSAQWGLDQSWIVQFGLWISGFVALDWGRSFATGAPVAGDLFARIGWSAFIGLGGMLTALLCGFGIGFFAAIKTGGVADRLSRALAIAGQALPAFAVGVIALWIFAAELRWIQPFAGSTLERLVLPIALVAFFSIGSVSRLVRAGFMETLRAPYLRTAMSKGLSFRKAVWRHGRRRATIGLLAGIAPDLAWVIGGTAIAEIVFGVPGLSERVIEAVATRDYPVLQAYIALVALWLIIGLQMCGLIRRTLDPRFDSKVVTL
ncbi:MAG: ABC transporter permease [Pseudomonadota bacterium]